MTDEKLGKKYNNISKMSKKIDKMSLEKNQVIFIPSGGPDPT